jgi:DNA-binding transcriptional LysR family regulator
MSRSDQISRRIKLRHLNAFLAVVEHGSMAKAAAQLSVTQPVVSKTIADLEDILGVLLFDRGAHGVDPTIHGQALVKRSVALFDDLRATVSELEFLSDPTAGKLRIGAGEAMSAGMLPTIISQFGQQFPRVDFEVVIGDIPSLIERGLRARKLDLIMGQRIPPADGDDIEMSPLYRDRLWVAAGAASPWARKRKVALADLANERWCLPVSGHPVEQLITGAFLDLGLPPPPGIVTVTSATFTSRLVAGGQYLGVFGGIFLDLNSQHMPLKKLPVDMPKLEQTHYVVALKNHTLSPLAQRFISFAREVARTFIKGAK